MAIGFSHTIPLAPARAAATTIGQCNASCVTTDTSSGWTSASHLRVVGKEALRARLLSEGAERLSGDVRARRNRYA